MNIKNINLNKIDKNEIISSLVKNDFEQLSNIQKKDIQKTIKSALMSCDYILALNSLIIGIAFEPEVTFDNIRKRGLFRYSNFINNKCIIDSIVIELLEIIKRLNYNSNQNINYLNSIKELRGISKTLKELNLSINKEIILFDRKYKNKSLIKTILAYVDFLFLKNHIPNDDKIVSQLSSRTKEDISSAASLLIFKISELRKLRIKDCLPISEEFILEGNIEKILLNAIFIQDIKEFEILIDSFNYQCKVKNENIIKIFHENVNFQKSIDLGYIRWSVQGINDMSSFKNTDESIFSLEKFVEDLYQNKELDFFEYTEDNNYPRYRIKVPEPAIDFIFEKFIAPDLLFAEEVQYLMKVHKEQLITFEDLKNITLRENFTLYDFIKVNRVFALFYLLFAKKTFEIEKDNPILILRSLIPSFTEDQLYEIFSKIFTVDQLDQYLDLICWDEGLDVLFDLQYRPIIYIQKKFLVTLSVLANSNILRNIYASEYKLNNKNLILDGKTDPLVNILANVIEKSGIKVYKNSPLSNGEVDLFFIMEEILFVIECKKSLHPTSIYDLRTTYDYILKAEKQIDNIVELFLSKNLLSQLEKVNGINLNSITKIEPCILLSNRLFNGNVFKYPIRNHNELIKI